MATVNPFDLLGDYDTEDPLQLIASQQPKKASAPSGKPATKQQNKPAAAKLPSKPLPPSQAVREAKSDSSRGGRGGGHGRRGGFSNREVGEGENGRPRRAFERHSGTEQGNEMKREGAGRGEAGEVDEGDKNVNAEKPTGEENAAEGYKGTPVDEVEEKEPEHKEMTLEEYEKVLEERRQALQALKTEERKVDVKEFESMQQLTNKKNNDDVFVKLGSEKDKRKELTEKEERAKKSVSINEFLKPTKGERYYSTSDHGRDRGRGSRGGYSGGGENKAPFIEDPGQFPTLGSK
ncbi:unnamed protein product [Fraxinus pennsylvanica]|uniref:Hyaluronan/mRNA-binding protein domain-containing protein n=1 Tax=Fraxinus pennsylvanica TaxID=56036 RepID=A0AAD1ZC65_9LAMI|nr:unnamed protein product [Fraxinus pennsylvanica]